ncbi:hypothetical protein Hanom_Chr10g00911561 [Helianthus anomalus]
MLMRILEVIRINELASALSFLTENDPNPFFPDGSNLTKDGSNVNNLGLHNGEGLSNNVALNFNVGFEMFSFIPPVQTKLPSEDGSLVMEKNLFVTESNSHAENTVEATSQDCPSSHGGMVLNPNARGFPNEQVHSNMSLSLSNITGESIAANCGWIITNVSNTMGA